MPRSTACALALVVVATLLVAWLNAAAGLLGIEDDDPANLLYAAAVAAGFATALLARFRPHGLARGAFVTAGALALIGGFALGYPNTAGPAQIVLVHGLLVALLASAGLLFRKTARAVEG